MKPWKEVKEKFHYWPHTLWQWASSQGVCSICGITGEETAQEFLVYVEGQGDTEFCKMCYFSKFVDDEKAKEESEYSFDEEDVYPYSFDQEDLELWWDTEEFHVDELPTEVITLDNWS